jgi:hypothetical protein
MAILKNPALFSGVYNLDPAIFEQAGLLDPILNVDTKLFVDPLLFPQTLHVRSPKEMRRNYPVGTRFRIYAKLTDKEGGRPFLHTHHNWDYEVVD